MSKEKEPKKTKGSTLSEEKVHVSAPDYDTEEQKYLASLLRKLGEARDIRDKSHREFDNLTYTQYFDINEARANTQVRAKLNRVDTQYQSGTLRTKLLAFLSSVLGLNLKADITAYNEDNIPVNNLGQVMETTIEKTEELEMDKEQRVLREYELLKHGTVFVEDLWIENWTVQKEIKQDFVGQLKGVSWTVTNQKDIGKPKRTIIPFTSVFLGDMTKYFIKEQPFIYTVQIEPRAVAQQTYGSWERWDKVPIQTKVFANTAESTLIGDAWRLTSQVEQDQVEIIKYQDKWNNEFQILLNGVPMLPMGYPLTAISPDGEYTISQQNLEPIRHNFAIGKSFVFKNKNLVAILDEMMKLGVLKTQKSFMPPYLNVSGRVISKRIFMPGNIARGISPQDIKPVSELESRGVTPSEFSMIQKLMENIDSNTASQTFTGAKERGGSVTATQIIETQRQARITMGLLILSMSFLEQKLTDKRISILLKNWFNPIDTRLDEMRQLIKNKYRTISNQEDIEGEGRGLRILSMSEKLPTPQGIMEKEKKLSQKLGKPIRITMLNPLEIKSTKLTWVTSVVPKDKKSSELSKLMFRAMVGDAIALGLSPNPSHLKKRFADVWDEDPNKLFQENQQQPQPQEGQGTPTIKPPQMGVPTQGQEVNQLPKGLV